MINVCNFASSCKKIIKPLWLSGDDEFLKYDTANTYINFFKAQGYSHKSIELKASADWQALQQLIDHRNLFPEKKILACELNQKSLTKKIDQIYSEKFARLPKHIKILLISNKLAASSKKSALFQQTQELTIWPLKPGELVNWAQNHADFLEIAINKNQLEELIKLAHYEPINIKNSLNILHTSKVTDIDLCVQSQSMHDNWYILEQAMIGNMKALLLALKPISEAEILPLLHVIGYCVKNALKIIKLKKAGNQQACNAVIKWPKQQKLYQDMLNRPKDWHKIAEQLIKLEAQIKGSKKIEPNKILLTKLLSMIAK